MAGTGERNGGLLRSWKEIAAYLGYDERTCARWEKTLGLPVHRAQGGPKSRVFARKDELDAWFARTFTGENGRIAVPPDAMVPPGGTAANGDGSGGRRRRLFDPRLVVGVLGLGAVLVYAALRFLPSGRGGLADFRIEESRLVGTDARGRPLWTYETGIENLQGEAGSSGYREHFQARHDGDGGRRLPFLIIRDIDGDGRKDVLLSIQTVDESDEGTLFRIDDRGHKVWEWQAGREMRYGGRAFSADYRVQGFEAEDVDDDGRREIVVVSTHNPDYPCQVAVLDGRDGRLRAEYWNSGHIGDFTFLDLDGDGGKEIVAAGMNNQYGKAAVIVLDPLRMGGASPNTGTYRCESAGPGREAGYILLSRSEMDRIAPRPDDLSPLLESAARIDAKRERISVQTGISRLVFEFDRRLNPVLITVSNAFRDLYAWQADRHPELPRKVDEIALERSLRAGLLYWTGSAWSSVPVPPRFER